MARATNETNEPKLRRIYALLIAITVPLGFASRMPSVPMPSVVRTYGGDVLSATCIFFGVRFLMHRWSLWRCVAVGYTICVLIELQQLIQWKPLLDLRNDTPAGILLGHGFLWSDIACYAVGSAIGAAITAGISAGISAGIALAASRRSDQPSMVSLR